MDLTNLTPSILAVNGTALDRVVRQLHKINIKNTQPVVLAQKDKCFKIRYGPSG